MPFFERYLSVWGGLAIIAGVGLGLAVPPLFQAVAAFEYAHVNLAVAVFIWVMVYPMMIQIDFTAIKKVGQNPRGLLLTLVINWLIKPFTMAALGWLFFKVFFAGWVDPQTATEYIAGMILLGVAPCTAMVFVWSHLTKGDANYTLVQVSINDLIMVVAFAPLTALLLGVTDITVPWDTLLLSVALYVVLPLVAGYITRRHLENKKNSAQKTGSGNDAVNALVSKFKPFSVIGLLLTIVILFGLLHRKIIFQRKISGFLIFVIFRKTYIYWSIYILEHFQKFSKFSKNIYNQEHIYAGASLYVMTSVHCSREWCRSSRPRTVSGL